MLEKILSSKSKVKIIRTFIENPKREFCLVDVAKTTGLSFGTAYPALKDLVSSRAVVVRKVGRSTLYKINDKNPMFPEIKELFAKEKAMRYAPGPVGAPKVWGKKEVGKKMFTKKLPLVSAAVIVIALAVGAWAILGAAPAAETPTAPATTTLPLTTTITPSTTRPPPIPRGLIFIDGDSSFTPSNGVNGGGSGTKEDPYIIENWVLNASSAYGIWIKNTTKYFVVRNCLVENGYSSSFYYGIYLDNVINGKIENNTCRNNSDGIRLESSSYNNLINNTCENNGNNGILLDFSSYNNLTNNNCGSNGYGIWLFSSSNNNLTGNTCGNNFYIGIWLYVSSDNNTIFHNHLFNNTENNAYGDGANYWDENDEGNYWSDWQPPEHPDADGDGIVDEPRPIDGGTNVDHYPLVLGYVPPTTSTSTTTSTTAPAPPTPFLWELVVGIIAVILAILAAIFLYRKLRG
jgi:parallel beta-helix repeat protein